MAFNNYEMVFAPILPAFRSYDAIKAALAAESGASGDTQKRIAEIELLIVKGDELHKQKKYEEALKTFKRARALIYKILYPSFDIDAYIVHYKELALPYSVAIANNLIDASIKILDVILPKAVKTEPLLGQKATTAIDKTLLNFTKTGFHESVNFEETLQTASNQGIQLLVEKKPEAALTAFEYAKAQARSRQPDPSLLGGLELNISSARLQLGDHQKALSSANLARRYFGRLKDTVGTAQANHLMGVSYQMAGNADKAKQHFKMASDSLKKVSANPAPVSDTTRTSPRFEALDRTAVIDTRKKISVGKFASRNIGALKGIIDMNAKILTFRMPGRAEGWGTMALLDNLEKRQLKKSWHVGIPVGEKITTFEVAAGKLLTRTQVINSLFKNRVSRTRFADLRLEMTDFAATTMYLTHLYGYILLIKIADTLHSLGHYDQAEQNYLLAAKYSYLNRHIEASLLWNRLAKNAIEWGHSLYKAEEFQDAKVQYAKIITQNGGTPNSFLYRTASLSVPANTARSVILKLLQRPLPSVNWEIIINVLTAYRYLQQIADGLDFYGLALSPIHTFEYLQSVARGFAQEAVQAEREFVNFKSRQEAEETTRRDLETTKAMADAEADARYQQYQAAKEDESAAKNAHDLAVRRRNDAQTQRNQYAATSSAQIWAQAAAQAQGMGEDSWYSEISELADKLARGESIHGPRGKLAAAYVLWAGRKTRAYELQKMQDNINQLTQAINIAKDQWDSAKRRTAAAEIAWQAALQRAAMAANALDAFDAEFFTPDAWGKMADVMRDISRSYLFRAIRIAKLMERAYNFENDAELRVIKNEYGHGVATPDPGRDVRLLGGDSLMKDIDSFTYHAITTKTRKNSRIKDIISLSTTFPAQFEEFRQTGLLSIETDLYEFDRLHPGYYSQRIEAVEIEIIGVLPEGGPNGTLILGGVTRYRKKDYTDAQRVHQVDTMALSDFVLRQDAYVYTAETGVRGLFQGFGLGTTWQIHLPKRSNNFDFRRIFDINLIIYYTAMFHTLLRTQVLAAPPRPGELAGLITYAPRHDFPDAWYGFYQDGRVEFSLDRFRLPMNQQNFVVQGMHFRVVCINGVSNEGIDLEITGPDGVARNGTTSAEGVVTTENAPLNGLIGTDPLGQWRIRVTGGAPVTENGDLRFDRIYNIQIGLEYSFEYVEEVL